MDNNDCSIYNQKGAHLGNSQNFQDFYQENSDFFNYGPSQASYLMLNKILDSPSIPLKSRKLKLKHMLLEVFEETALNELQLALWAIFLENIIWKDEINDLKQSLIISALYSKDYFGEPITYLFSKFSTRFPDFRKNFIEWKLNLLVLNADLRQINDKYSRLLGEKTRRVNYNYYVDDVLEHYVAYKKVKTAKAETYTEKNIKVLPSEDVVSFEEENPSLILQPLPLLARHNKSSTISATTSNIDSISLLLNFDV